MRQGFTLVELSIVLVIIGLLIGSVLVGQSLINAAGISATVAQRQKYTLAAVAFRKKMGGLPGDLTARRAASFGLTSRAGSVGQGDGNDSIENGSVLAERQGLGHETALFWRDLSDAALIDAPFTIATDAPAASLTLGSIANYMPVARARKSSYFHVYAVNGRNFFYLGGFADTATDASGVLTLGPGMSTHEAFLIDDKQDDGIGSTGTVIAVSSVTDNSVLTGSGGAADCLNTDGSYNADPDDRESVNCRVSIRAGF